LPLSGNTGQRISFVLLALRSQPITARPGFEFGSVYLGFMVDEVTMGHIFLHVI
jgi:hypothetical protein